MSDTPDPSAPAEPPEPASDPHAEPPEETQLQARMKVSADMTTWRKHQRLGLPQRGAMSEAGVPWLLRQTLGNVFTRVDFGEPTVEALKETHAQGQVVYLLQTTSLIDYLYFNWAFLKHGVPLSRFANGLNTMWIHGLGTWLRHSLRARSRARDGYQIAAFDDLVQRGAPVALHLNRSRGEPEENLAFSQPLLVRLMQHQRDSPDARILVVPLLLVWDKRPDPARPTLIDDLFGTSQAPGFWRKALQFVNMTWQSFFMFGAPVVQIAPRLDLGAFRQEVPEADLVEAAELLRERLERSLAQERQVIMGPPLPKPRALKEEILRRAEVVEVIRQVAAAEEAPEPTIRERASEQLDEIAANASLLWTKILGAILSPIFYLIYKGFHIDHEGLERLRNAARDSRVILVPSHKSHIDYLVLSYVFYQRGLTPPHIAAGVNLSFWPVGPIFRRSGAFFLRRTFRGDPLYAAMFRQYLIKLLEEGATIEFFPEGTRSRTGKMLKPRYGMVHMILDAFASGRIENLIFQPISVGYEKIIEGGSYRRESMGADKEAESAASLLKASSVLISDYGRVYIEFSEPIRLADYMKRHQVNRDDHTTEQRRRLGVRLAHRIMYEIAEVTPVTPTSLVAMVILNAPAEIDLRFLFIEVGFLLQLLLDPDNAARLSAPLQEALRAQAPAELLRRVRAGDRARLRQAPDRRDDDEALGRAVERPLLQAVTLLQNNKTLSTKKIEGELFYSASREQRTDLSYYKNNLLHFFVPEALLAAALLAEADPVEVPLDEAQSNTLFLSKLFRYEFFYPERPPGDDDKERSRTQFEASFFATLTLCQERGWLTWDRERGRVLVGKPQTAPALEYMRSLILPWIEAYAFVSQHLGTILPSPGGDADDWMTEKELMRELLRQGQLSHARGDLTFFESLSKPTYENAVRLFIDLGIIDADRQPRGRRGKPTRVVRLDPQWRDDDNWSAYAEQIALFTGAHRRKLTGVL